MVREDLGGNEGRETMIRIYYMKKHLKEKSKGEELLRKRADYNFGPHTHLHTPTQTLGYMHIIHKKKL